MAGATHESLRPSEKKAVDFILMKGNYKFSPEMSEALGIVRGVKGAVDALVYSNNSFARAMALMRYNSSELPDEYIEKFGVQLDADSDLAPDYSKNNWTLCTTSEERYVKAMEEDVVMRMGGLLVKFRGRITGLCFQSFSTDYGTFVRGNYYAPDKPTQAVLKENLKDRVVEPEIRNSEWFLIRPVNQENPNGASLTSLASRKSRHMPDKLMVPAGFGSFEDYLSTKGETFR